MKAKITEKVVVPSGVTVTYENDTITVKGPKGEVSRHFFSQKITPKIEEGQVLLHCDLGTRREQRLIFTLKSHLKNMVQGVQEPWVYELKVCSSHFPMNVKVDNNVLKVKNFLGEKTERTCKIPDGVKVSLQGPDIRIESTSIELAGNVASAMELTTRISNRDLRVFQDGVYITKKAKQ